MIRWTCALTMIVVASCLAAPSVGDDCRGDSECEERAAHAANLCKPVPGGAAAWANDPFSPSIPGVGFYEEFDPAALVARFGPPTSSATWEEMHQDRDPTTGPEYDSVIFTRLVFPGVAIETARLHHIDRKVVLIDITSPTIPLKCGIRVGMSLAEVVSLLGLPKKPHKAPPNIRHCSVFYDLYDLPFTRPGGFTLGDNKTLCFYADRALNANRIVVDKRRWVTGYH